MQERDSTCVGHHIWQLPNESMMKQQQLRGGKTDLPDIYEEEKRKAEAKLKVGEVRNNSGCFPTH